MNKNYVIMYKVVAPWNKEFAPIWYKTLRGAKNFVSKHSINTIPFDSRFLTIETRPSFNQ